MARAHDLEIIKEMNIVTFRIMLIQLHFALASSARNAVEMYKRGTIFSSELAPSAPIIHNYKKPNFHINANIDLILQPEEAFNFNFNCGYVDSIFCVKAEQALKIAGARIAKELLIRVPINVYVNFKQLESPNIEHPRLAEASPNKVFAAQKWTYASDLQQELIYPQALLKQSHVFNPDVLLEPFDMAIDFNAEIKWNLDSNAETMPDNYHDLEYVAVHEIVHGLGFVSQFANLIDAKGKPTRLAYPTLYEPRVGAIGVSPPYALDSLVYGRGPRSVADIAGILSNFGEREMSDHEYMMNLQRNSTTNTGMKVLYRMLVQERLHFRTPDGSMLQVYQPKGQFAPPAHTSSSLLEGPEFLMTPRTLPGKTLNQILMERNVSKIFGPITMKIMESIGYASINNNQMIKLMVGNKNLG